MGSSVDALLAELSTLYERSRHPFPYDGCRKLRRDNIECESLEPELDLYLKTIAGYCTWGKKLREWPKTRIQEAQIKLAQTFFEENPRYKALEPQITESNTPDVYRDLVLHEQMRTKLRTLFSILEGSLD